MSVKSQKTARHKQDEHKRKRTARQEAEAQKRRETLLGEHFLEDLHVFRINRVNFKIYIGGDPRVDTEVGEEPGVEHNMADRFAINMGILQEIDPTRPVLV